jgi:adenine-specific DNA-methyltransferase
MHAARLTKTLGLLDFTSALQEGHEATTSAESRKEIGQVFTPPSVCRFMASLLSQIPERFQMLDPGAGIGALTAAVCERILCLSSPRQVEIVLYETDAALLPLLEENLRHCREAVNAAGHNLRYTIHGTDFITHTQGRGQKLLFEDRSWASFDAVIMNPPYFKIGAGSAHALAMGDVIRSQPNIYTLFMARAAELLRPNGELVAITPRSFCNGLYFRDFRRWFFSRMALRHVHLFECRRSTFDNVLQESVITYCLRMGVAAPSAMVTTSLGREISENRKGLTLPVATLLDDSAGDMVLRIPATDDESAIIAAVECWPERFQELGLRISTGPVVMFRAEDYLLPEIDGEDAAPLIGPHNVKPFETVWPLEKRGKPMAFRICPQSLKQLVPTRNYVLLRRFSAKEERRRLTASLFLKGNKTRPYLALENHLNYVYHARRELSDAETYGLAAMFNSALLDGYFRIISGNTQVNATEIRSIKFPSLDLISRIGERLKATADFRPLNVERIVLETLGINGELEARLLGMAL